MRRISLCSGLREGYSKQWVLDGSHETPRGCSYAKKKNLSVGRRWKKKEDKKKKRGRRRGKRKKKVGRCK